jgi:nicotinamide phosphoribosyltransferase
MKTKNIIYTLDSYKHPHADMLPKGTEYVYSYCEARKGSMYDSTVFLGLQYILKEWLCGVVVTKELIDEAAPLLKEHFKFNGEIWSRHRWDYIVEKHGGKLPILIKALPEGTKIPVGNALFTIVNLDKNCAWLTNALETLIQQVWYPTTVATRSNLIVSMLKDYFKTSVDDDKQWLAEYYLHDFGQRGTTGMEAAGIGGAAHLVNSKGTDTVYGMIFARDYYNAKIEGLGYSVPASEHSIATSLGEEGEFEVVKNLISLYPKGILSVVSDSFSIENAVDMYCTKLKGMILERDGKFVVRPDSPRFAGDTPQDQVLWIVKRLEQGFGSTINSKGYKVLNPKVGVIYGDSLTETDIHNTLELLRKNGYSAESCVYGCGGYLLQRCNRDTMRFAIKSSAQCRDGVWYDIYKAPRDASKASKRGRLSVAHYQGKEWVTLPSSMVLPEDDQLRTVFENGNLVKEYTFDEIRNNAAL